MAQSNSQVERSNETILKVIRIAQRKGSDWKKALASKWKELLQNRHADRSRCAQTSSVVEGDQVLLQKNCQNKLSPTFEP